MFKHYLKMAIRQILKNKIQYLLSIIGIAVGRNRLRDATFAIYGGVNFL